MIKKIQHNSIFIIAFLIAYLFTIKVFTDLENGSFIIQLATTFFIGYVVYYFLNDVITKATHSLNRTNLKVPFTFRKFIYKLEKPFITCLYTTAGLTGSLGIKAVKGEINPLIDPETLKFDSDEFLKLWLMTFFVGLVLFLTRIFAMGWFLLIKEIKKFYSYLKPVF